MRVEHADGSPPYTVKWTDDDRETLFFPGPEAHVENAETVLRELGGCRQDAVGAPGSRASSRVSRRLSDANRTHWHGRRSGDQADRPCTGVATGRKVEELRTFVSAGTGVAPQTERGGLP